MPVALASTALSVGTCAGLLLVAVLRRRETLRRIRRLRWLLRSSVLREEHRCRERHRDRGK